jgi:hypothetical protein
MQAPAFNAELDRSGNAPYLRFIDDGSNYGLALPLSPDEISSMEARGAALRGAILSDVPHDNSGLDIERVTQFMQSYGLDMHPFITIASEHLPKLEEHLFLPVGKDGEIGGAHYASIDFAYITRFAEIEKTNGTVLTEGKIIHEQSHANTTHKKFLYIVKEDGTIELMRLRMGFKVNTSGDTDQGAFFEEGFAATMQSLYILKNCGPQGLSRWSGAQTMRAADNKPYKMPRSYFSHESEDDTMGSPNSASLAAFGIELLIAKDPLIFDAMLAARTSSEGLIEFAQRIEALGSDTYKMLRLQPYTAAHFMLATSSLVQRLYDGDPDKALGAVMTAREDLLS